ncbi:MAG: XRE family transcriptional regulator [Armatimonadetes bacterium]|nr:XRE family transcriptional regulator [Armatimonadota bacterium]
MRQPDPESAAPRVPKPCVFTPGAREETHTNILAALGLPDPDLCQTKATLSIAIEQRIQQLRLTQVQAAERMGLGQPDVSDIVRGRLDGFSLDCLVRCLNALGQDVEIVIHPPKDTPGEVRATWLSG